MRSARDQGCVLLFGGRQSGKSTALKHIAHQQIPNDPSGQLYYLPVYVDLMRLPYDAGPWDFFSMLYQCALDACKLNVASYRPPPAQHAVQSLDGFEQAAQRLRSGANQIDLRFVFLLDESKRVIGDRFPRGFHDNIFHLLYGDSKLAGLCSIVFAGAQELYRLCEDDTSPIGSRAAKHCLTTLSATAMRQMAEGMLGTLESTDWIRIADEVHKLTGGHAGLGSGLLRLIGRGGEISGAVVAPAAVQFRHERSELFHLWSNSLTKEARTVHDGLLRHDRLDREEMTELLRKGDLPVYRLDRIVDELQYVGIARLEGSSLVAHNRLYWDQASYYSDERECSERERSVWKLIEETEIGLRTLVRQQFTKKWGRDADRTIEGVLGREAWEKIIENRDKHSKSYPLSGLPSGATEILNYTYLGQLGILMTWKKSWFLFQGLFRDLREFQDILRDITPVRNDGAHFRSVPEQELDRCRVRCVDLLAILERNGRVSQV
ncbi:MAG: hypothetical protein ABI693_27210 [Bryobacteraceae bacterium]